MRTATARALTAAALLAAYPALAAPGDAVSFVTCPIARDTGPDADVCFYAEHGGTLYGLSNPTDWGSPQLKHRILVEGRVKDGPTVCGGQPLEGRASVLPEIDESCNRLTPFDGSVTGVAGGVFNSGTPEQRAYARALAQRAEADPSLSLEPVTPEPAPIAPPQPPYAVRTLSADFPFASERGSGPDMGALARLADYARLTKARRVEVVGRRGISRLDDGSDLAEPSGIAEARTRKVAGILAGLGVSPSVIVTSWNEASAPSAPGDGWRARTVVVTVTP